MKTKLFFLFLLFPTLRSGSLLRSTFFFCLFSFIFCLVEAQVPQGFNYQAIARDASGNPLTSTSLQVMLTIQSSTGTIFWKELHPTVGTNNFGLFTLVVGTGARQDGVATFDLIDWSVTPKYLKTEIKTTGPSFIDMGTSQLYSVPYAMTARSLTGTNKLGIKGTTTDLEEAIFEVKNKNGQTIFAVYNEGVRIYVDDGAKGTKGGFAVGGFDMTKATKREYLVVSDDSIRMYLDSNPLTKGKKGGFAVGGFDMTKGIIQNYLDVSDDSIRMYIDDTGKGTKGGFAVGGFDNTKGGNINFLNVATDASGIINPSENRVLWYPLKNAFIVGKVLVEKPDSVGENSFASGYESQASGDWSQALGFKAAARGNYSTAIGNNTNANGLNSFAFGNEAKTKGSDSYAFGTGAIATGASSFALGSSQYNDTTEVTDHTVASADYAFALGFGSAASSTGSFAMGVLDSASGPGSLSMGYFNRSRGWFSTTFGAGNIVESNGFQGLATGIWTKAGNWCASSFGDRTYAKGHTSFATGFMTEASGQLSSTFGDQTKASSYGSMAIGRYNYTFGNPTSWITSDPVFMVGIGSSTSDRRNALTVLKNGVSIFNEGTTIYSDYIEINGNKTGNRFSLIDFHSDDTYPDFSFRILRNTGANASTDFIHRGTGYFNIIAQDNANIEFATANTQRMVIRYNGNVGIGVAYPGQKLEVAGIVNLNDGISSGVALQVYGREALWYDYSASTYSWGYGASYNVFAGKLSVGTIATYSTYGLYVNGSVYATGGWAGSDARWKKDVEPINNVIPDLIKLQGVKYNWRIEEYPQMNFDKSRQIGLIAQDVEKVFPELVKTDDKGYKAISYEKLTVILLESLKEQQKQIDAQNERIEKLEKLVKEKSERVGERVKGR